MTIVEYYLDFLLFGEKEEKVRVVEMIKKEVEKIIEDVEKMDENKKKVL